MRTKHVVLAVWVGTIIAALILGAGGVQAQDSRRLHVVASFNILADIAAQVAGDAADVDTLVPMGTNPHTYEASAQDVVTLSQADLVLVAGVNFEENLLPVVEESAGDHMVRVSDCIPILPIPEGVVHDHTEEAHTEETHEHSADFAYCEDHHAVVETAFSLDHAEAGESLGLAGEVCTHHDEAEHAEGEHVHEAGSCDPHVWTDPVNAALWTLAIRDALSARDPANAATYATNAEVYLGQLTGLDAAIRAQIETIPTESRFLVTNHLTFDYFSARYGLTVVGVVIPGGSTTAEPSVQDVLALIETVQDYGVPAIFTETTVGDSLAQQIADESGAEIVSLYTESLSDTDGPASTYLDYMTFNAAQITGALAE